MQEEFLHYLWKLKKFNVKLKTVNREDVSVVSVGQHNFNAGPDFFNAKINIDNQLWAGNVEIHVKSSDWYIHNHEKDQAYDNVILHVVWEHDTDIYRKDNTTIPTLELEPYISKTDLLTYNKLFSKAEKWINCETEFSSISPFIIENWLERLYFERLQRKALEVEELLKASKNNWEAVLFKMLAKNFGSKVNGEAFFSLASSMDFSIVRKLQNNQRQLEALFYGQANLLIEDHQDSYFLELKKEYRFLCQKFKLNNRDVNLIKFFRLRPPNFPTIRISQLATLYNKEQNLFSKIIEENNLSRFYDLFAVVTSDFWQTHYNFAKESKSSKKVLSKSFIDLLIVNTIIPIKFSYAKFKDKQVEEDVLKLISAIKSERNSIVDKFNTLKPVAKSTLESQGLIQLKNEYCDKNKCLQCAIGNSLLNRN